MNARTIAISAVSAAIAYGIVAWIKSGREGVGARDTRSTPWGGSVPVDDPKRTPRVPIIHPFF